MDAKIELRVVAGRLKGRAIMLPPKSTTRATKSIVKSSVFNTIQNEIIGKNFVEVFAGSGSMGIEALSRGAAEAVFLEQNRDVFVILNKNLDALDLKNSSRIHNGDSFSLFPQVLSALEKEGKKTYFYFDPPFEIREGMENIYSRTLELIENIPQKICECIIIETQSDFLPPEVIGCFKLLKTKKFGKTAVSYYK